MRRTFVQVVSAAGLCLSAALIGCGEGLSPFTPVPGSPALLLGDSVLRELSPPVEGHEDSVGVFSFDLSQDPMVLADTYSDVEVRYRTPTSCDQEVEVFDRAARVWRQIGFGPPSGFGCFDAISQRAHLLSHRGLVARDCLGGERSLLIRGVSAADLAVPTARAVRLQDDYRAVPIVDREALGASGLGYDGRSFWITGAYRTLFRVSPSGVILSRRTLLSQHGLAGVATDRLSVWAVERLGRNLLEFSPRMHLRGSVPIGAVGLSGLSWTGEDLYYSFTSSSARTLVRLHPAPRSSDPVLRPVDSLTVAPSVNDAFAWIGNETLAVAMDSTIDVITSRGDVLWRYPMPFGGVHGMVWDGAALWILHTGILSGSVILGWGDPVLTPLRMPDVVALHAR